MLDFIGQHICLWLLFAQVTGKGTCLLRTREKLLPQPISRAIYFHVPVVSELPLYPSTA